MDVCVSPNAQDVTSLHPLQQLVLVPGHLQSVSQFLLSQTQPGQPGKNSESREGLLLSGWGSPGAGHGGASPLWY